MRITFVLFFCVILSGCIIPPPGPDREPLWSDIDLSLYESVPDLRGPALEARDWTKVRPAEPTDYWELRGKNGIVIARSGEKCKTASNHAVCVNEFDGIHEADSKGQFLCGDFPPDSCYRVIVSNRGDTNRTWTNVNDLLEFLGNIDSQEEAILLIFSDNFYGSNTAKQDGAIREIDGEYELIVLGFADSIHNKAEKRFLWRINHLGTRRWMREQYPLR
jgi:hypothetical protein